MSVDWINLAQNKGKWQALVNAVMNIWVPKSVCCEFLDLPWNY
jgi:hypothetical protein